MSIINISIRDEGVDWHKEIRIFGIAVYSRHDYTKIPEKSHIGFNSGLYCPGEIVDDDYLSEEDKKN